MVDHGRGRDLERRPGAARTGDADAFGHRHKVNIGEVLASELKARTGIEAVASELTYDLRSGEPDMLDSMVASTFANIAMDLIRDGIGGRMAAIRDGKYAHVLAGRDRQAAAPGPARRVRRRSGSGPSTRTGSATRCC